MSQPSVFNVREESTRASVRPQYNLPNFGKAMFTQVFQRITSGQYPPYIDEYLGKNDISWGRVERQLRLIADLLDSLFNGTVKREQGKTLLASAMDQMGWHEGFDWAAMAVFDMLASQGVLASYFMSLADTLTEDDIRLIGTESLRKFIDHRTKQSLDMVDNYTACKQEGES